MVNNLIEGQNFSFLIQTIFEIKEIKLNKLNIM